MVFHAGSTVSALVNAAAPRGRCVVSEIIGDPLGQVGGEAGAELRRVQVEVGSLRPVGLRHVDRDERQRCDRVRDRRVDQLAEHLAAIGGERGEIDERFDVGVAARGLRDHGTAVGVTDHDLGARDAVKERADGRAVELQIDERVRCGANGIAVIAQPVDDRGEPGRVGERAVHDTTVGLAGVGRASALAAKAREAVASATVASAPRRWRTGRMGMVLVLRSS